MFVNKLIQFIIAPIGVLTIDPQQKIFTVLLGGDMGPIFKNHFLKLVQNTNMKHFLKLVLNSTPRKNIGNQKIKERNCMCQVTFKANSRETLYVHIGKNYADKTLILDFELKIGKEKVPR
jgi:hypothetical protein